MSRIYKIWKWWKGGVGVLKGEWLKHSGFCAGVIVRAESVGSLRWMTAFTLMG
jgi:hypothetical protein